MKKRCKIQILILFHLILIPLYIVSFYRYNVFLTDSAPSSNIYFKYNGETGHINNTNMERIKVDGDFAYIAAGNDGLLIADISNPNNPEIISQFNTPGFTNDVLLYGKNAIIADNKTIRLIDITNPNILNQVAFFEDTGHNFSALAISGEILYSICDNNFIRAINISNPLKLEEISNLSVGPNLLQIKIEGNTMYIAADNYGLKTFSIEDPTNIIGLDSIHLVGEVIDIILHGDVLFAAVDNGGIRSVNITDPSNLEVLDSSNLGDPKTLAIYGDVLYFGDEGDGISAINIWDVTNLTGIFPPNLPAGIYLYPEDMVIDGDYLYIIDKSPTNAGLHIVEIAEIIPDIKNMGIFDIGENNYENIEIQGDYLFATERISGLQCISIKDDTDPSIIGESSIPFNATGLNLEGNIAYVTVSNNTSGGIAVINISDPRNMEQISFYSNPFPIENLYIEGDFGIFTQLGQGIQIINVSDPYNIQEYKTENFSGNIYDVIIKGNIAYLAGGNSGIYVLNVSDLLKPALINTITTSSSSISLEIYGNLLYAGLSNYGIEIINITSLKTPNSVTQIITDDISYCVDVSQDCAIIGSTNKFYFVNMSDLDIGTWDQSIKTISRSNLILDSDFAGDYAYIIEKNVGIQVYKIRTSSNDDYDNDNLDFFTETWVYSTNPLLLDTDGDGLNDSEEVNEGIDGYITDPLNGDSDGDGYSDYEEFLKGSNPNSSENEIKNEFNFELLIQVSIIIVLGIFVYTIYRGLKGKKNRFFPPKEPKM